MKVQQTGSVSAEGENKQVPVYYSGRPSAKPEETNDGYNINCDINTLKILYKNEKEKNHKLEESIVGLNDRINELIAEKDQLAAHYEELIARLDDLKEIDRRQADLHAEKQRKANELKGLTETIQRIKESRQVSLVQGESLANGVSAVHLNGNPEAKNLSAINNRAFARPAEYYN